MDFSAAIPVLKLTLNGTVYRYSHTPYQPDGFTTKNRVKSFGNLRFAASGISGKLEPVEFTVQISDDGELRDLAQGVDGGAFKNAAAELTVYEPGTGTSSVRFTGIVKKKPSFTDSVASLTLRCDDRKMTRNFLRPISKPDWPDADESAFDEFVQHVYGNYDSASYNNAKGMIRLPCVDTTVFKYGPVAGYLKAVDALYVNEKLLSTSYYSVTNPKSGGRRYTLVNFTAKTITANSIANPTQVTSAAHGLKTGARITITGSNSTPTIDGEHQVTVTGTNTFTVSVNVTVAGTTGSWYAVQVSDSVSIDCRGYEPDANGSGVVIKNPVTILQHTGDNFVFDDFQRGSWKSGATPIDSTTWTQAATDMDALGYEACGWNGGKRERSFIDVLQEYCTDFGLRSFWKGNGTIGLVLDDNRTTDLYKTAGTPQVIQGHHFINTWDPQEDDSYCIGRVLGKFSYSHSQDKFLGSLEVQDFEVESHKRKRLDLTHIVADNDRTPRAMVRETISRYLRLYRTAWTMVTAVLPMRFCDNEVMTDVNVSHPNAKWGNEPVNCRPFRIMAREEDWTNGRVTLTLRDLKPFLVTFWDTCRPLYRNDETASEGRARLVGGASYSNTRASKGYVDTPQGEVAELANDSPKNSAEGVAVEGVTAGSNYVKNSSFKDGVASQWTKILALAAADDTTSNIFEDTAVVAQSCKLTAPTPVSTGDGIQQDVAVPSTPSGTKFTLSVDHEDDSAQPLTWSARRSSDNAWWRESDASWQATEQDNNFTIRSTRGRDVSRVITPGGSVATLRLRLRAKTAAGQINHIHHVQLQDAPWASTRLLTQGAAVAMVDDNLLVSNFPANRTFNNTRGSFRMLFRPFWNSADVVGETDAYTFFSAGYDLNNYRMLEYYTDTGLLTFTAKAAGVIYTTSIAASMSRLVQYRIGCRWASSVGELGLTAYTMSVFFEGVKGTDVVAAAVSEGVGSPNLLLGGGHGIRSAYELTQQVLEDADFSKGTLF